MMRILPFLFLIIFTLSSIANEQPDSLLFTGQIFNSDDLKPIEGAVFSIHNRHFQTGTNASFRFVAAIGDTVIFSHLGYQNYTLKLTDTLQNNEYLAGVFLSRKTYQLSEVLVVPRQYKVETLVATDPISSKDMESAKKNIAYSARMGLVPLATWDAAANQQYVMQKHTTEIRYKTQVAPSQTLGVSTTTTVPGVRNALLKEMNVSKDLGSITTQETFFLTTAFDAYRKQYLKKERSVTDTIQSVGVD